MTFIGFPNRGYTTNRFPLNNVPTVGDPIETRSGNIGVVTQAPWTNESGIAILGYRATWAGHPQGPTYYTRVSNVQVLDLSNADRNS